jgi:hypothetical protein
VFATLDWCENGFAVEGPAELRASVQTALEDKCGALQIDSQQTNEMRAVYRKSFDEGRSKGRTLSIRTPSASYRSPHFTEMLEFFDSQGFSIETTVPVFGGDNTRHTQRYILSKRRKEPRVIGMITPTHRNGI